MKKVLKSISLILVLSVIFTSAFVVNSTGLNKEYKTWNFLADTYAKPQGFPTTNTFKDLDGNPVWSTWVLAGTELSALKPVSSLNGITPAIWSKDGTNGATGAPIIQIRPATANMCRVTPAAAGTPVLRWTSNITSTVKVTAFVMKEAAGGNGTTLTLYNNMNEISSVSVSGTDTAVKELSKTLSVKSGDTVEIGINSNGEGGYDLSTLNLVIEEVDPLLFDVVPQISYTDCGEVSNSITPGGTVGAKLGVKNSSEQELPMIGVLVVYTDDGILSGIGFDRRVVGAGETTALNCNVENYTPDGYTGGFKIKMYVLNSLTGLAPLYQGYSYPPTEKRVWDFEKDNVAKNYPSTVPFGDSYGASQVWSYGMGNHDATIATRPYDFRPMIHDAATNTWYNGEDPKMNVTHNFPYIKVSKVTGESELQTRSRTAAQQQTEGSTNARLHPIVRFISPLDGEVDIKITVSKKAAGGDGLFMMLGYDGFINPDNAAIITFGLNADTKVVNKTITVRNGMCLDFMLHGLGNNDFDGARMSITITEK